MPPIVTVELWSEAEGASTSTIHRALSRLRRLRHTMHSAAVQTEIRNLRSEPVMAALLLRMDAINGERDSHFPRSFVDHRKPAASDRVQTPSLQIVADFCFPHGQ
jgi:hypothetical protein